MGILSLLGIQPQNTGSLRTIDGTVTRYVDPSFKSKTYASIPYERSPRVKSEVDMQYVNYNLPGQVYDRLA